MNLPKTFKQTCDKLYERHDYKLILSDGNSLVFDNYEDLFNVWTSTLESSLSHVEVLDKKQPKQKSKGFV